MRRWLRAQQAARDHIANLAMGASPWTRVSPVALMKPPRFVQMEEATAWMGERSACLHSVCGC
jgi:hypothetical protein